jgi:multidrug efflux system outer membrane protein
VIGDGGARACPRRKALVVAFLACLASGCLLGPDYVRPTVDVPDHYRYASDAAAIGGPGPTLAELPAWWLAFGDPYLDALVRETLAANRDLRVATARVDEFAARVGSSRAQGLPQVGYGHTSGRQRQANGQTIGTHAAVLSASWELDLWGRIRRETEAARADLFATEEARLGVALTLVSATVASYVTLLDLDRRLQVAEATRDGRKRTMDIFQIRRDGGAVSDYEMALVTGEYEAAVASIPDLRRTIAEQEHALSSLLGRNPGPIARGDSLERLNPPPVPSGLPSDLIARRPDILQAEQQLVAANARVGAARALYFPRLALTGTGGVASTEFDELFSGPTHTWSFVGQLLGPIFAGGAIESANRQADARREQAVATYERTIQEAFRDVDDSLAAIRTTDEEVRALHRRVVALERAVELARERYDNGYSDYLEVLDTERGLFAAQLDLAEARGDVHRTRVDLYRALGGDWIGAVAPLTSNASGNTPEETSNTPPRP